MQSLEHGTDELRCKTEKDSRLQRMDLWLPREGAGTKRGCGTGRGRLLCRTAELGPTAQHKELYLIPCDKPFWKSVKKYIYIKHLGMLPTHVFCLERTIFQTPGMKRRSNLLAFQKSLWPQKGRLEVLSMGLEVPHNLGAHRSPEPSGCGSLSFLIRRMDKTAVNSLTETSQSK